jgi:glutamate 5-kinase
MERYAALFGARNRVVGQVLLTRDVLARRDQYLHARAALERMLSLGVVPIVNENDTVVVDELKLGDNDRLAAIVSHLVDAGMLVILTDTDGLYSNDPRMSDNAALLSAVRHTDEILDELRRTGGRGTLGSGGVATKVAAARMAAWSGVPTVIAAATEPHVARRAVTGEEIGTWVAPRESKLGARKLWIAFGVPSFGRVVVDAGAAIALVDRGKSLLAAGVRGVTGTFDIGDAVEVHAEAGDLIGKGLVGLSSTDLEQAMGRHSDEVGGAAIHRDDLVILSGH